MWPVANMLGPASAMGMNANTGLLGVVGPRRAGSRGAVIGNPQSLEALRNASYDKPLFGITKDFREKDSDARMSREHSVKMQKEEISKEYSVLAKAQTEGELSLDSITLTSNFLKNVILLTPVFKAGVKVMHQQRMGDEFGQIKLEAQENNKKRKAKNAVRARALDEKNAVKKAKAIENYKIKVADLKNEYAVKNAKAQENYNIKVADLKNESSKCKQVLATAKSQMAQTPRKPTASQMAQSKTANYQKQGKMAASQMAQSKFASSQKQVQSKIEAHETRMQHHASELQKCTKRVFEKFKKV